MLLTKLGFELRSDVLVHDLHPAFILTDLERHLTFIYNIYFINICILVVLFKISIFFSISYKKPVS